MSIRATLWAYDSVTPSSSAKLVLWALANYANSQNRAYPSVPTIASDTGLDRKTVVSALKLLSAPECGLISDSGDRKGSTKQVVVWELAAPLKSHPNLGAFEAGESVNPRIPAGSSDGKNERYPKTGVLGGDARRKGTQISPERHPKTGHDPVNEPDKPPYPPSAERAGRSHLKARPPRSARSAPATEPPASPGGVAPVRTPLPVVEQANENEQSARLRVALRERYGTERWFNSAAFLFNENGLNVLALPWERDAVDQARRGFEAAAIALGFPIGFVMVTAGTPGRKS